MEKLLRHFGQIAPIIVDSENVIIDGHAVWETLQALGYDEISAVIVSGRSDPEIRALRLALNCLPQDAGWDDEKLRKEFQTLIELSFDLDLTAFSAVEIDFVMEIEGISKQIPGPGPGETLIGELSAASLASSLLDWHLAPFLAATEQLEAFCDETDMKLRRTFLFHHVPRHESIHHK